MAYVVPLPSPTSLAVSNGHRFPIRRVFCVGRNYAKHAAEMGASGERGSAPMIFCKPADAVVDASAGAEISYPPKTENLHHEIELAVAISSGGRDIPVEQAMGHVYGYGVALDLTRRDLQAQAKAKGHPWDWAKGFDQSAPVGTLTPAADIGHPQAGRVWLEVDGALRQEGDLDDQIWSVAEVIAAISEQVELKAGDLILTGTPSGVGPLVRGSVAQGGIDGVGELRVTVV